MDRFDLRDWRKARNMTQATLADALGVTARTIINWEQCDTVPAGDLLELACRTLELEDVYRATPQR